MGIIKDMAKSRVELKVQGMTCQGCVRSVQRRLSKVTGVECAHVDLDAGTATVEYDDSLADSGQLVRAVEQIGYQART
jgi:copper chaperone CopZ